MKRHFISAVLMAAAIFTSSAVLTSCNKDDDNDNNSNTNAPIEQPADESNDDKGGNNGGNNGGTTDIIENPKDNGGVDVENPPVVTADYSKFDCLNGSNYYVICLNSEAYAYLEQNNKVAGFLGTDDVNTAFYIWENTCDGASLKGNDCFGFDSKGGMSLKGKNTSWCGSGWCRLQPFDFSKIDESYTLHIAIRGDGSSDESYIAFNDPNLTNNEFKVSSKNGLKDNNNKTFSTDTKGEWVEYEYSVGDMIDAGVEFINYRPGLNKNDEIVKDDRGNDKAINFPAIGGFMGANVDIDAVFIYKK